ncbi:hypothetical protein M197_gp23 [Haloarcula hispanica tailed virus 2]|uniref:Uncharacterized protein n=1 Tax=Haloarcula hispanica tailed virus 2 TaxID=1273751 RepID=R4TLZ7_9CAUD|nr:hypothetical protein M197_gp23 [Haloarcula hispanica tailed virus 2]AGM11188.1 hypothetical protein HHTV2_23 [Haloarcula hispanica tailed virus 2]
MTDYSEVAIPDKPPTEYEWPERRAEILKFIENKGHPWGFNKSQLARRYGVSDVQIHKDFDRLREWYQDRVGEDALEASDLAYRRIIQEQMSNGEYEKARRALDSWNEWLEDRGKQEKAPERIDMNLDASIEKREQKALIGVDLGSFEGVDQSQMVGLDLEDLEDEEPLEDGVEVPLQNGDGGDDD